MNELRRRGEMPMPEDGEEIRRPSPIVEQPHRPITQCEMGVFYATSDDDRAFLASLARADFRHFSLPLAIEARRHEKNGVVAYQIEVRTVVKERDTGGLSLVILDKTVPVARVHEAWKAAYHLVRRLMLHEVDEAFHLDDERIYDPHAKDEI